VFKWPRPDEVAAAARRWAAAQAAVRPGLRRLGYFGSYATGTWGVGSDLDLVAIVDDEARPFHERGRSWDTTSLPVPAEILVYTGAEWEDVVSRANRFAGVMTTQVVWLWERV
jgi:hypothetical protein